MFSLEFESLDTGAAEERSTFGTFTVEVNGRLLTEGIGPEGKLRAASFGIRCRGVVALELVAVALRAHP